MHLNSSKVRVSYVNVLYIVFTLQVVEGSDWFVTCGRKYTRVRESLARVLLGESTDILDEPLKVIFLF